jgi:hypothetical protein
VKRAINELNVHELVARFERIAVEQYSAIRQRKISKYNELYAEMDAVDDELKRHGVDARRALLRLYDHPNVQVRVKAAIRTLAVAPEPAKRLLQTIAESHNFPQAADAGMILDSLKTGSFVPK